MRPVDLKLGIAFNYAGQFYTIIIGIFILPFYLKYLGSESYGLVGFFTMLSSLMILMDMGLSSTILRETARIREEINGLLKLKQLTRSIEVFFVVGSIVILLILLSNKVFIANTWLNVQELNHKTVESCLTIMAFMLVIRWFVGFYQNIIIGFEQQVWLNLYKIIINTFRFIGAFLLVKYISNDILHFFIFQLIIGGIEFFVINRKAYSLLPKTGFICPSVNFIRGIIPFAISLTYTSFAWILFTQLDKFMLSHYMSLSEYGYFALVVTISGGVIQISLPLTQAISPRMTALISQNNMSGMLNIYHKGTKLLSIMVISLVSMISYFSYELLYIWTDDLAASKWAAPVLFWYVIGTGIVSIWSIQHYLQYAFGNLEYEKKLYLILLPLSLPIIYFAVANYGAEGSGISLLIIYVILLILWAPYVHNKFVKNINFDWFFRDIMPAMMLSLLYIYILEKLDVNILSYSRLEGFFILLLIGVILLSCNIIVYKEFRVRLINILR